MKIKLEKGPFGFCYIVRAKPESKDERIMIGRNEDSTTLFVQTDWEYPGIASAFGWQSCHCGLTDGTVSCDHKTASDMILDAQDYLNKHIGKVVKDIGYFIG